MQSTQAKVQIPAQKQYSTTCKVTTSDFKHFMYQPVLKLDQEFLIIVVVILCEKSTSAKYKHWNIVVE